MMKISKYLSEIISVVIVLGGLLYGGYCLGINANESRAEEVEQSETSDFDLRLPGEVEKRIVTKEEIESKIYETSELSTYSGGYAVEKSVDEARYFIDTIRILGTKNTINIKCTGEVKVGYDMSEIVVKVGEDTIYVALPEAHVVDNHIFWDSIECEEKNSPFNPIEFSQYKELVNEIEAEGLANVESEGIYNKADEHFEEIIRAFLSEFRDYEIKFI